MQLRRNHFGVVEDEHVARREQLGQVPHMAIVEPLPGLHHEQPRGVAWTHGAKRDPLLGEIEVEKVDAHACPVSSANRPAPERQAR